MHSLYFLKRLRKTKELTVKTTRPTNLTLNDLRTIKLPITAVTSLLHRISGVILFLAIPTILWLLSNALSEAGDYNQLLNHLNLPLAKFVSWIILCSLSYHIVAGIRHLFMDMGFAESMQAAKSTSTLVLVIAIIMSASWGAWIW